MCFSSPAPAVAPAPAPPAPAPLAQAVSPETAYNAETAGNPNYSAGVPNMMRDPSIRAVGQPGVGGVSAGSTGLGSM